MENNTMDVRQPRHPMLSRLGVVLLIAGFVLLCLVFLVLVGGSWLAEYYDARQITWRAPDAYVGYPLLCGFACSLFGFVLYDLSRPLAHRSINVVKILTGIVFLPLLFVILSRARPVHPTTRCLSNQRQLAAACAMYAQDHDGRLPRQLSEIGLSHDAVMVCPSSRQAFHPTLGYGLNSQLTGKMLAAIPEPARVLLTADSIHPGMRITSLTDIATARHLAIKATTGGEADTSEDFSQPRGCIASFADGHVEFVAVGTVIRLK